MTKLSAEQKSSLTMVIFDSIIRLTLVFFVLLSPHFAKAQRTPVEPVTSRDLLLSKAHELRIHGLLDSAQQTFAEIVQLDSMHESAPDLCESLYWRAVCLKNEGTRLDEALALYRACCIACTEANFTAQQAMSLYGIGAVQKRQNQTDSAAFYLIRSVETAQLSGDSVTIAKTYQNLANFYLEQNEFRKGIETIQVSIAILAEYGPIQNHINALITAGGLYLASSRSGQSSSKLNDLELASQYYAEAHALSEANEYQAIIPDIAHNLASIFIESNNMDSAYYYANEAIDQYAATGQKSEIAAPLHTRALIHSAQGRILNAIDDCEQAFYLSKEFNNHQDQVHFGLHLAEFYRTARRFEDASSLLSHLMLIKDSLYNTEHLQITKDLQTRYETAQKDQQMTLLKLSESKSLQEAADSKSRFLVGTVIFIFILLLLSVYTIKQSHARRLLKLEQRQLESTREQEISQLIQTHKFEKLTATVQGEEKERDRLAKEIHDGVGGRLNGVALQLEAGKSPDALAEELRQIQKELRHIAHNISVPHFEENTLVELVQLHLHNLRAFNGLEITFVVFPPGQPLRLDHKLEINLYRMIQELLNNVVKHAQASTVDLQITQTTDYLEVMIEDNGLGFDPASAKWGIGLKNLRERVEVFDGSITFDSKKGRGTIAIIKIPTL